jgi:hypothetical protein
MTDASIHPRVVRDFSGSWNATTCAHSQQILATNAASVSCTSGTEALTSSNAHLHHAAEMILLPRTSQNSQ